jgi:IS1 family transposase
MSLSSTHACEYMASCAGHVIRYFIKKETEETKQSLIETLAMLTAGEMPQDNYPVNETLGFSLQLWRLIQPVWQWVWKATLV